MRRALLLAVLGAGVVAGYGSAAWHAWGAHHGGVPAACARTTPEAAP